MGPRKQQPDDAESKPSSSFVHLSYKSLVDFDNLRKTEDTHFLSILRLFSQSTLAATLGSYVTAKSHLFQDRFGSLVIAGVLVVILANTPVMNKSQRLASALLAYFFGGCFITTVLWWNFGMSFWVILRYFTAIPICTQAYSLPFMLQTIATWLQAKFSSSEDKSNGRARQKNDTNRMMFFVAGPLSMFAGLVIAEPLFKLILGVSYFLTQEMRMQVVIGCSIWFFIHGQFNFVKCRLYDRDAIWQMIQLIPETVLSLYFVPKSVVINQEDDY